MFDICLCSALADNTRWMLLATGSTGSLPRVVDIDAGCSEVHDHQRAGPGVGDVEGR